METKGHYFLVGVFTLSLALGIVLFIAWMMSVNQLTGTYKKLLIYFPSNVNGLSEGSQVAYRGVPVGKVVKIQLDPHQPDYAMVLTHIKKNTPLHANTSVNMGNVGITGLTYIELETNNDGSPPLTPEPGTEYYVLRGTQSRLDKLLDEVPVLVSKFTDAANQLITLLDKENIEATSNTLANMEKFTHNLVEQQKNINQILVETRDTMHTFSTNTGSSFDELNSFLRDSRTTANEIKDLSKSLEDNPSRLIFQPKYKGYKVTK